MTRTILTEADFHEVVADLLDRFEPNLNVSETTDALALIDAAHRLIAS